MEGTIESVGTSLGVDDGAQDDGVDDGWGDGAGELVGSFDGEEEGYCEPVGTSESVMLGRVEGNPDMEGVCVGELDG